MNIPIGIRREDKNEWERRVPIIPEHVKELKEEHGIEVIIQPSKIRIFSDDEYVEAGAKVQDDLSPCPIIFAIKEIPLSFFEPGKTYVFFSHTTKGQPYNMPMLKKMLELKCQLIDYEKIVDAHGNRLIAFGKYAGIAGMIDTLWILGQRLNWEGFRTPFLGIKQAIHYENLREAREEILKAGETIGKDGLPATLTPLICGITGYGNVSKGAQEILDLLPMSELAPKEVVSMWKSGEFSNQNIYKVVFKEEDMVEQIYGDEFELQDYYEHPEKYRSRFHTYIPYLTLLVNGIYWDERYPRLVTKEYIKQLYKNGNPHLRVIGDISCDVNGSIECTVRHTNPGNPVYVYDPLTDRTIDGWTGVGPVILAVDNLPCELPKDSSVHFSEVLKRYVPEMVRADFSGSFDRCGLPPSIKNGVIVYKGELTINYRYIENYLRGYK